MCDPATTAPADPARSLIDGLIDRLHADLLADDRDANVMAQEMALLRGDTKAVPERPRHRALTTCMRAG